MITITPLPAFSDNYIWLLQRDGQAVVVDPGDAAPVIAALESSGLALAGILVTHHHFDHIGGIPALLERWQVPVWGPDNPQIDTISQPLRDGDEITVLGQAFQVIAVPGHTLDHLAYFSPARNDQPPLLFCGDTLFAGGCGRMFEGTAEVMYASLMTLAQLPPETRVYCAHEYTQANIAFAQAVEPDNVALQQRADDVAQARRRHEPTVPSNMALELCTNPFLRCHIAAVKAAVSAQGLLQGDAESQVFGAVRAWKDNF